MNQKTQQANMAALHYAADELLQAHQGLIDAWYDGWVNEQRERAAELLRKRRQPTITPAVRRPA